MVLLLGRTSQAWNLAALASRILVALGFHRTRLDRPDDEDESAIRHCLYWCFYLDKTLSMLLIRPSSLPPLQWEPASLVPIAIDNPLTHKVRISVRLSQVQDTCLPLLATPSEVDEATRLSTVAHLESELHSIRREVAEVSEIRIRN